MQYLSSALRCSVGDGWEPNCITAMELNQRIPKGICVPSPQRARLHLHGLVELVSEEGWLVLHAPDCNTQRGEKVGSWLAAPRVHIAVRSCAAPWVSCKLSLVQGYRLGSVGCPKNAPTPHHAEGLHGPKAAGICPHVALTGAGKGAACPLGSPAPREHPLGTDRWPGRHPAHLLTSAS